MPVRKNVFEDLLTSLSNAIGTDAGAQNPEAPFSPQNPGRPIVLPELGKFQMNPEAPFPGNPGAPGYSGPQPAAAEPMSVQPGVTEANMSVAPAAASPAAPLVEEQASLPDPKGKVAGGTARRNQTGTGKGMQALASPDDEFAMLLAKAAKLANHGDKRDKMSAERDALMSKSENQRELSDQEKVGMAIIAALPALLGAIGGGAVAGGAGAAAGAAGGLTGAGQGINAIAAGKEASRKEFKGDAEKITERIAQLDAQIDAEKEKAADRSLGMQLQERSAKKVAVLEHEKMQQAAQISRDANRTHITTALIGADAMTRKASMSAGAGGRKIDDADKAFYDNAGAGMRAAKNIDQLVKAGGANIGAHLSDEGTAQLLDQQVAMLAHAFTKIGDPNSAVLLAELENTKKSLLAEPTTTRTQIFLKKMHAIQQALSERAVDHSTISGIPLNPEVSDWVNGSPAQLQAGTAAGSNPAPHGHATVVQNGVTFNWNGQTYVPAQ